MTQPLSERLQSVLASARLVVAFTGAGISAESGVPTFRGADGIWKKMSAEELASMDGFLRNPDRVWEWYQHRRTILGSVEPNAGHRALVEMESLFPHFTLVTQNIDDLHRRAGATKVVELHGNITRNYCLKCGSLYQGDDVPLKDRVPTCGRPGCGGMIRPDVVWFGEMLPEDEWEAAARASESADLFFSIGTSAVVYPAASLPLVAHRSGAFLVEINTEPTPLADVADEFLMGPAGVILPEVVKAAKKARSGKKAVE